MGQVPQQGVPEVAPILQRGVVPILQQGVAPILQQGVLEVAPAPQRGVPEVVLVHHQGVLLRLRHLVLVGETDLFAASNT